MNINNENKTISLTKNRLCLVIVLCMIAGYPIGYYFGATEQQQSDEEHLINFAETGKPVLIQGNLYNITEIQPVELYPPYMIPLER